MIMKITFKVIITGIDIIGDYNSHIKTQALHFMMKKNLIFFKL